MLLSIVCAVVLAILVVHRAKAKGVPVAKPLVVSLGALLVVWLAVRFGRPTMRVQPHDLVSTMLLGLLLGTIALGAVTATLYLEARDWIDAQAQELGTGRPVAPEAAHPIELGGLLGVGAQAIDRRRFGLFFGWLAMTELALRLLNVRPWFEGWGLLMVLLPAGCMAAVAVPAFRKMTNPWAAALVVALGYTLALELARIVVGLPWDELSPLATYLEAFVPLGVLVLLLPSLRSLGLMLVIALTAGAVAPRSIDAAANLVELRDPFAWGYLSEGLLRDVTMKTLVFVGGYVLLARLLVPSSTPVALDAHPPSGPHPDASGHTASPPSAALPPSGAETGLGSELLPQLKRPRGIVGLLLLAAALALGVGSGLAAYQAKSLERRSRFDTTQPPLHGMNDRFRDTVRELEEHSTVLDIHQRYNARAVSSLLLAFSIALGAVGLALVVSLWWADRAPPDRRRTVLVLLFGGAAAVAVLALAVGIGAFRATVFEARYAVAKLDLRRIAKGAEAYFERKAAGADLDFDEGSASGPAFPPSVGPTPASRSCCREQGGPDQDGDGRCDADARRWDAEGWQALRFERFGSHWCAYRFESHGQGEGASFAADALCDLRCDGEPVVFRIAGRASSGLVRIDPVVEVSEQP